MHAYLFVGSGLVPKDLSVGTNQLAGYNAYTAAGSPADPCAVTVTVTGSIIIADSSRRGYALDTGTWPTGSTFKLIVANGARIEGYGGDGGDGSGGAGSAGGAAVRTRLDITIDNTTGNIWGGGGGGSGGNSAGNGSQGGGGGGGGQGNPGGSGGSAGGGNNPGSAGSDGSVSSNGAGGTGGSAQFGFVQAGDGGAGSSWGGAGQAGAANDADDGANTNVGAAGKAVDLQGYTVTWAGGYNSTQVKGPVA